ncbi:MAG: polysaccharide biosynthesis/export family protein [Bacteroidetes bacterium]|nr:polysaccharide biosynthesis/export family protein [Bacteroidota bacterium]
MARVTNCFPVVCFIAFCVSLCSCNIYKKVPYFTDISRAVDDTARNIPTTPFTEPLIHKNDILQISILTLDPQANSIFSTTNMINFPTQPASSYFPPSMGQSVPGFMVDREGMVDLPVVGKVKVEGLTTAAIRDTIQNRVSVYYKGTVVNVRFANMGITIIGEVKQPATYVVTNEKISILDIIGLAGDLTIYGKRENVLLIRDSAGTKQYVRFDLNSSKTLSSPYFYLRQGDVVYVEPNKQKVQSTDFMRVRNYAIAASTISLLFIVITNIKK